MSSLTIERAVTFLLLFAVCMLQTEPAFAQFTGGGEAAKSWLIQLFTPFIGICVLVFFVACCIGRGNWMLFGVMTIGIVGYFGYNQVISLVRNWFSV